jgi:septal ring factor EnvC (AmiA/AmiB activator)
LVVLQGERVAAVAQGPWLGRDGFVAETAVQFDRVQGAIARLERELEKSRQTMAEIAEEANRARRFQAFEETVKNSRDYKINDLQRGLKDTKARLEAIEGDRSTFVGLTYKSFDALNRKLAELSSLQLQVDAAEAAARRNATLFYAALGVAALAMLSHFFF